MKTGPTKKSLIGQKFGRWTVVAEAENTGPTGRHVTWLCRCACGNKRAVKGFTLTNGASISCGCLQRDGGLTASNYRHGQSHTLIYYVWAGMLARCTNPKEKNFHNYGGRGIKVCERWHHFENFRDDMSPTWQRGLTIERMDVNGNYEPSNCCWITQQEQMQNVRHAVYLNTPWGRLTASEAARRAGLSVGALRNRMRRGCSPADLLAPPRHARASA